MLGEKSMRNREQTFVEGARRSPSADDEILKRRINELGLKLEGSVLEVLLRELEAELIAKGIKKVKPVAYLTDEWGCPEGIPIIGIPYYLADERVKKAADDVAEGDTESEVLKYLRHEMGHVFNYAYRLYARPDWAEVFGPYSRPYVENYTVRPFSQDYVRHIAGWYAQKHPDEDWSETFAVWLTPESDWASRYRAGALKKLKWVDRIVREYGEKDPEVAQPGGPGVDAVDQLSYTVGEHIERFRESGIEVPPFFDGDLKDLFDGRPEREDAEPAGEFLGRHRKTIVKRVSHWTGVREGVVGSLVDHLIVRSTALSLLAERRRTARRMIDIVAYCTTLSMNFLYQGTFIPGSAPMDPAAAAAEAARAVEAAKEVAPESAAPPSADEDEDDGDDATPSDGGAK
jgi:hypothetical protein